MNRLVASLILLLGTGMSAMAQTYTEHVQQAKPGYGKVTITEDKAIDDLVNGKVAQPVRQDTKTGNATRQQPTKTNDAKEKALKERARELVKEQEHATNKAEQKKAEDSRKDEQPKATESHKAAPESRQDEDDGMSIPTIDMRKKVMRHGRKVTGYRVQAFAGGNTRKDKQTAQQTGNAIKMAYPDQPVYVHFYSPRWICRVGNFRTYQEAAQMLRHVKGLGYKSAIIVKGTITVFE